MTENNQVHRIPEHRITNSMGYVFIALTIFFTVFGQLIIKSQVSVAGEFPPGMSEKLTFMVHLLLNPWILSGMASAFLASLAWMAALTQFELSFAYPFMSLSFVFVLVGSALFFREPLTWTKLVGVLLILLGVFVVSR